MTTPPAPREARASDAVMLTLVRTIQADITAMQTDLSAMQQTLGSHIATEPKEWAIVLADLMKKSFPDGDADGHREAHEAEMQAIRDRAAFWQTMRMEVSKWGIIGVLSWLSYHAWVAFIHGPK